MKKVGIPETDYISFVGHYEKDNDCDIPQYNLIELAGRESIPAGSTDAVYREIAEEAKDEITQIIKHHTNE